MRAFSTKHYIHALNHFRRLLSSPRPTPTITMACLLLFIHIEALRENFASTIAHVKQMSLLLGITTAQPQQCERLEPTIRDALTRIDIQASAYMGSRVPELAPQAFIPLPETLMDFALARKITSIWTSRLLLFLRSTADHIKYCSPGNVPLESIDESTTFQEAFSRLEDMLAQLQARLQLTAGFDVRGIFILKIRVKLNRILSLGCLYAEESIYDAYLDDFRDILRMCWFLGSTYVHENMITSVLLDEGILEPLNHVAKLCRDGHTRHAAIAELRKISEQRNTHSLYVVLKMVERCVALEEDSLREGSRCSDIPEWRRIHSCGFDGPQSLELRHVRVIFKSLPNGADGDWGSREETISW